MADAESKKPADARRHGENFVAKLVTDPANPPKLMRLSGYKGASSQEGSVRLYGNPELSIYWDIPEGDVLYEQPVPPETDPLGAVILWVKQDAKITSNSQAQAAQQGGQQPMNTYPTYGAAAAPQANLQITPTIIHSFTPVCHSPYFYCPPPSPLPYCLQPMSPTCTFPQTPQTIPTTIPTTVQTGTPVGGGFQAAAPQGFTPQTFGQTPPTFPPSVLQHCTLPPSILQLCTLPPSILQHCTIPVSILCNSPTPVCVGPVSPTCTLPQTVQTLTQTIPTTIPTSEPGSFAGGVGAQGGFQAAAPQAAQFGFQQQPALQLGSPLVVCARPIHSLIYYQCQPHSPTPVCYQVSPYCTPGQLTVTIPTTIQTGTPVAGGFQAQGGGAGQQAFTFTPLTLPTNITIHTPPTPVTVHPTVQTYHPTLTTIHTVTPVTITPITPVTF